MKIGENTLLKDEIDERFMYNFDDYFDNRFKMELFKEKNENISTKVKEKFLIMKDKINNKLEEKNMNNNMNIIENKNNNDKKNNEVSLKRKRGRRPLYDKKSKKNIIHKKSAEDNVIYKLKTNCFKCILTFLNAIMKKKKIKGKLSRIEGKFLKDGKKLYNLTFFQKKIKDILLLKKCQRYTLKRIENDEIIYQLEKINKIKEILDMTFLSFIENIFMKLTSLKFEKNYGVKNKFLFRELKLEKLQKKTMEKLVNQIGIINYFNSKTERYPKSKLIIKIDKSQFEN